MKIYVQEKTGCTVIIVAAVDEKQAREKMAGYLHYDERSSVEECKVENFEFCRSF